MGWCAPSVGRHAPYYGYTYYGYTYYGYTAYVLCLHLLTKVRAEWGATLRGAAAGEGLSAVVDVAYALDTACSWCTTDPTEPQP